MATNRQAFSLAPRQAETSTASMDVPRLTPRRTRRQLLYAGLAVVVVALGAAGARQIKPAAPMVERAAVWMDVVRRGPMVREVLGQGLLVAEEVRWIAAKNNARVETVLVKPGAAVKADTVIMELSSSDLQLQALEANRQLAQAAAELTNLRAALNAQALAQKSVIASLRSELGDVRRRVRADEQLARQGFLSALEREQARDRRRDVTSRLSFERRRLAAQVKGMAAQLAAQSAQIERLRSIAQFRSKEVRDLRIRAGVDGVLQELTLQVGQSVSAGAPLAKLARPGRLKAEVRIPETQAKDVQVGQKASIDTRNGIVAGRVARIDPAAQKGTVLIDVTLEGALPAGARPDLNIEGKIEVERVASALHIGRPALSQPGGTLSLFKVDPDGGGAERVPVRLGRSSVKIVEVVGGLAEGDRVILSEMAQWDHVNRIRIR